MNSIKKYISFITFTTLIHSVHAQIPDSRERIVQLLELTGSGDLGVQMGEMMVVNFKQTFPDVHASFWEEFLKEFNSDAIIDKVVPIYEKHFTSEEIEGLIEFYQTPLGQKTIRVMPDVMTESMQVGQEWGRQIGEKVYSDLKEKGLIKE